MIVVWYRILHYLRLTLLFLLIAIGIYFLFIREILLTPDLATIENYKTSYHSEILDISNTRMFYLYDRYFRFKTDINKIPEKVWRLLFNKQYLLNFQQKFYLENDIYSNTAYDIYLNYLIRQIYFLDDGFFDKIKIMKIRKKLMTNNFDAKSLIINELRFSKEIYGFETASRYFFNKSIDQLNDNELVFCIANIDYYSNADNLPEYILLERYANLKKFIETNSDSAVNTIFKFSGKELALDMQLNLKINEQLFSNISTEYKTGVNLEFIKFYVNDYLINQRNYLDLFVGGYSVKTTVDLNFLYQLEKKLNIDAADNSNKICLVSYKDENDSYYLLGIINLPFGLEINSAVAKLANEIKYNNCPVQLEILPIVPLTYIDVYNRRKTGIIPIAKIDFIN